MNNEPRIKIVFSCWECGKETTKPIKNKWYEVIFAWNQLYEGSSSTEAYKYYFCSKKCLQKNIKRTIND